eukprot:3547450-Pyramimonas_sp.AAC.1
MEKCYLAWERKPTRNGVQRDFGDAPARASLDRARARGRARGEFCAVHNGKAAMLAWQLTVADWILK